MNKSVSLPLRWFLIVPFTGALISIACSQGWTAEGSVEPSAGQVGVESPVLTRNAEQQEAGLAETPITATDDSVSGESTDNDSVDSGSCIPDEKNTDMLDRTQQSIYRVVCSTTRWFDGFFGDAAYYEGNNSTYGQINFGTYWDQRDAFNPKARFRARLALPALRRRTRLLIGMGDTDNVIDGSDNNRFETPGQSFRNLEDEDVLLGFGFSPSDNVDAGWDFALGATITSPIDPYARVSYRWLRPLAEDWQLRLRERVFWRQEEGWGTALNSDLNHLLSPDLLVRWGNHLKVSEGVDGLYAVSNVTLYQALSNKRAMSYAVYAKGETGDAVELQNYGFEIRFRRRFMKKEWFFIEFMTGISWPREFPEEQRKTNLGAGLELELHFGDRNGDG